MSYKPPRPGDPCGPLGLPASYRTYQLIQLGLTEGRYNNTNMKWEVPDGSGGWVSVYSPKNNIGPTKNSKTRCGPETQAFRLPLL